MDTKLVGYKAKAFEARNLAFYFLLVFGMPLLVFGPFMLGILKWPARIGPGLGILFTVVQFAPLIAAFVVTGITEGKPGVKALWRRFWNRDLSLKWLLVILLLNPALRLVASLVDRTLSGQTYPFLIPDIFPTLLGRLIIGIQEEFGWRGYALPRFQARWNALTSSIILGAIWAPYHLGNWFLPPGDPRRQDSFWEFALWIILLSILTTWIFNNTNGSILAAVLFHAVTTNGLIDCCSVSWGMELILGVYLLAAILIVIIFGPRNLVRHRVDAHSPLREQPAERLEGV
jgi:membrane protease YdiL (CAAX protease family)